MIMVVSFGYQAGGAGVILAETATWTAAIDSFGVLAWLAFETSPGQFRSER